MADCFRHVNSLRTILSRVPRINSQLSWPVAHRCLHTRPLIGNTQCLLYRASPVSRLGSSRLIPASIYGITSVRTNTTAPEQDQTAGYVLSDIPPMPDLEPIVSEPLLTALGEPTLSSLGLCAWTPPGFLQSLLETIHVTTGMPWWSSIMILTLCMRTLMFPVTLASQKSSIHASNHMPTVQKMQEKFTKARTGGNPLEAARASEEMISYMNRNNVKPFKAMLMPMLQMPVFLSVFIGIRKMANLPVESLSSGGTLWFTDLAVPDPYFILPCLTSLTLLATVEIGADGLSTAAVPGLMKLFLRGMPFILLPVMANFPAALCTYWLTSNVFALLQCIVLKIPWVRDKLNMPIRVVHEEATFGKKKKGIIAGIRESIDNASLSSEAAQRERMAQNRFKDAGKAPVERTYSYNPKQRAKAKSS